MVQGALAVKGSIRGSSAVGLGPEENEGANQKLFLAKLSVSGTKLNTSVCMRGGT